MVPLVVLVVASQAKVHPRLNTPLNATVLTMVTVSIPSLVIDINLLASMVSMGTLATMAMVCLAINFRRYYEKGSDEPVWPIATRLILILLLSIVEGLASAHKWGNVVIFISLGEYILLSALAPETLSIDNSHFSGGFKPK